MGQIIKAVVDGKERELEGLKETEYSKATHYFYDGQIYNNKGNAYRWSVPLRLVHKQHVFGPITYEETGEELFNMRAGQARLSGPEDAVICCDHDITLSTKAKILIPVKLAI